MASVASSTTSPWTSGYIFSLAPERFGGTQEFYCTEVKKIVTSTTAIFLKAVEEKRDLREVFHQTLAIFGQERRRIAKSQRTDDAESYGLRRDDKEHFGAISAITPLFDPYEAYNKRLLPIFLKHLNSLERTSSGFKQTELQVDTGNFEGKANSLNFSVLNLANRDKWAIEYTEEYYHKLCSLCGLAPLESSYDPNKHLVALIADREAMKKLKETSIVDYNKLKLAPVFVHCGNTSSGMEPDWVIATVRTEINNKMVALSYYVSWMSRDFKEDPTVQMMNEYLTIIHQDPFLIDTTLQEIARLFKLAIECTSNDQAALTTTVANLRYLYAHAMPFVRGSAATGEWFEQSIFQYHGYSLEYKKAYLMDMEAISLPLKDFVKLYPFMMKLTKLEHKSSP